MNSKRSAKIIAIFLILNLFFSMFSPFAYAAMVEDAGGGGDNWDSSSDWENVNWGDDGVSIPDDSASYDPADVPIEPEPEPWTPDPADVPIEPEPTASPECEPSWGLLSSTQYCIACTQASVIESDGCGNTRAVTVDDSGCRSDSSVCAQPTPVPTQFVPSNVGQSCTVTNPSCPYQGSSCVGTWTWSGDPDSATECSSFTGCDECPNSFSPSPTPLPAPLVYDPNSQEGLLDQNQAQALQQQIQQQLDYSQARREEAPLIVQVPDNVVDTAGGIWGSTGQTINNVTSGIGGFFGSIFTPQRADASELDAEARRIEEEQTRKAEELRKQLESGGMSDDDKGKLKEQYGLSSDAPDDELNAKLQSSVSNLGINIQGDLANGNFVVSTTGCANSQTTAELGIAACNPAAGDPEAAFNALKTIAEGIDPTALLTIVPQIVALDQKKAQVNQLQDQAGIFERLPQITGKPEISYDPRTRMALYADTPGLVNAQDFLTEVVEQDRKLNPDETLTPDEVEARNAYEQQMREYIDEENKATGDALATLYMTLVGGKIAEGGIKVVGKGAAWVGDKVPVGQVLDNIGSTSVVKKATGAISDAYDSTVGKLFGSGVDDAGEGAARTAGREGEEAGGRAGAEVGEGAGKEGGRVVDEAGDGANKVVQDEGARVPEGRSDGGSEPRSGDTGGEPGKAPDGGGSEPEPRRRGADEAPKADEPPAEPGRGSEPAREAGGNPDGRPGEGGRGSETEPKSGEGDKVPNNESEPKPLEDSGSITKDYSDVNFDDASDYVDDAIPLDDSAYPTLYIIDRDSNPLMQEVEEIRLAFTQAPRTPNQSKLEEELIGHYLDKGMSKKEILDNLKLAQQTSDIAQRVGAIPDRGLFKNVASALKYDSTHPETVYGRIDDYHGTYLEIFDAIMAQKENARMLEPVIEDAQRRIRLLANYAIENGADPSNFAHIDNLFDSSKIHLVDADVMGTRTGPGASGLYLYDDKNILILRGADGYVDVCTHECIHSASFYYGGDMPTRRLAAWVDNEGSFENANKLLEGMTEWTNKLGGILSEKPSGGISYAQQVSAVGQIANVIGKNVGSDKKAQGIIIEATLSGDFTKVIEAAGNGDALKGKEIVMKILEGVPVVDSNVASAKNQIITSYTLAAAGAAAYAALTGGSAIIYNDQQQPTTGTTENKGSSIIPNLNIVKDANAKSGENVDAISASSYGMLVKKELIKQALLENGKVDSQFIKDVMASNVIESRVLKTRNGFVLVSGINGSVEGDIDTNRYKINIDPLPDIDIAFPSTVEVNPTSPVVIPVSIKAGSGKVEKKSIEVKGGQNEDKQVTNSQTSKVKAVVFKDDNGNGLFDKGESVLSWAGIKVRLTKVDQQRSIKLLSGWNLVTLTALSEKPITASGFLTEIAKQGGHATTISSLDDGVWKSFVARGDKEYSGEDFQIEVGKAYFVKALKKSILTYQGQELVAPVKLNLASGWNAVGMPYQSKAYKASNLIDEVGRQQGKADTVAWWESGLWDTYLKKEQEGYGNDFAISSGNGYILKVGKETEFTP